MKVKSESEVAQSCPTRSDPIDCSLPGSSTHGIFQAKLLEWGAIAFSASHAQMTLNKPIFAEEIYDSLFVLVNRSYKYGYNWVLCGSRGFTVITILFFFFPSIANSPDRWLSFPSLFVQRVYFIPNLQHSGILMHKPEALSASPAHVHWNKAAHQLGETHNLRAASSAAAVCVLWSTSLSSFWPEDFPYFVTKSVIHLTFLLKTFYPVLKIFSVWNYFSGSIISMLCF